MKDKVDDLDKTGAVYYNECVKKECLEREGKKNDYVGETERVNRERQYEHRIIDHKTAKRSASIDYPEDKEEEEKKKKEDLAKKETEKRRTRSSTRSVKRKDYKIMSQGPKVQLTEGSTEFSAHVAKDIHEKSDLRHSIICIEDNWLKRGIKEAIAIRKIRPTLNLDDGRYHLSAMYDQFVGSHVTLKPRKGTRDASAQQN